MNQLWIIYVIVFCAVLLAVQGAYWFVTEQRQARGAINRRLILAKQNASARGVFDTLKRERGLIGLERVTEELLLLTEWWRGPINGSDSYVKYRKSSPELYADALSVLLNSPGSLQQRAPTFFNAFLAYLDRKPEVKAIYDQIQAEIRGGEDVLMGVRREQLDEDVDRGWRTEWSIDAQPGPA